MTPKEIPIKPKWEPNPLFKPEILQHGHTLSDLNTWIQSLCAYIKPEDVENFGHSEINLTVHDLLAPDVRQSIEFDPSESLPLFETSAGPSLISKLRDLKVS